jgi:Zn-dependent membrane protease YugP
MGGFYGYGYGFDFSNPYILVGMILMLIGIIVVMVAQTKISKSYNMYSKIPNSGHFSGAQVAREILDSYRLQDVEIKEVTGRLSDHYNPNDKTVNLSKDIYQGTSIAAVSIAAHECGHAIQHKEGYQPLIFRNTILPVCNIGQGLGMIALFIGLILSNSTLAWIGVLAMTGILLFQVATLPVEFDASSRALTILNKYYLQSEEYNGAKSMLSAAAFTYVAGMLATLLTLLRYVLLIMGNNRD